MHINVYHRIAFDSSKKITAAYSNSFSLAIRLIAPSLRDSIYSIYGFVRLADEIVDTFHDYDKASLLNRFEEDVYLALKNKISLNPALHSFQITALKYNIGNDLIAAFLSSMRKDLYKEDYSKDEYIEYIYGSADVVGLMCLKVFTEGNETAYETLKPAAMKLGSAFQKVNFLRDIKDDYEILSRSYFPHVDLANFTTTDKQQIIGEIEADFKEAYTGIRQLPSSCRVGVYTAYLYYMRLLKKLGETPCSKILHNRISIPNYHKLLVLVYSYCSYKLRVI